MISVWCCHHCVHHSKPVTLLWLRVVSKLLLVCTNSRYQLESGTAPTWTCCRLLLLPDTVAAPVSLTFTRTQMWTYTQPHKPTMNVHTPRRRTHTFRCGCFGMQGAEQECSLALTGEAVWQAQNKTRKWRLEMCLGFSLTFPPGSLWGANRYHMRKLHLEVATAHYGLLRWHPVIIHSCRKIY